jgi:cupin 2 domain-containing protein
MSEIKRLSALPPELPEEVFEVVLQTSAIRVERILSKGHRSPRGFWYDQEKNEWVVLLQGAARLRLADPDEEIALAAGDSLLIPAHRRHRVEWTIPDEVTVWLAVWYPAESSPVEFTGTP